MVPLPIVVIVHWDSKVDRYTTVCHQSVSREGFFILGLSPHKTKNNLFESSNAEKFMEEFDEIAEAA
jgi:hypothetical protein